MKIGLIMLFTVVVSSSLSAGCMCGAGYSEGERSGVIVKFSRKGLIWKSWEGTMNTGGTHETHDEKGNLTGVVPSEFLFHVPDGPLVDRVRSAQHTGSKVTLRYTQWLMSGLRQDSDYDVVDVAE